MGPKKLNPVVKKRDAKAGKKNVTNSIFVEDADQSRT